MSIKRLDTARVIIRPGFNVRQRARDLSWLRESIREVGQWSPILVVRSRDAVHGLQYFLVQGEGRLSVIRELQLPKVRAIVLPSKTPIAVQMMLNIVENKKDDVHFLDLARRVQSLHDDHQRSFADIATETGYSYEHITNCNRVVAKVDPAILAAAYTLDQCPVAFLIRLAAMPVARQMAEWESHYGAAGIEKKPRRRISLAAIKRHLRDAPADVRPGLVYLIRHYACE